MPCVGCWLWEVLPDRYAADQLRGHVSNASFIKCCARLHHWNSTHLQPVSLYVFIHYQYYYCLKFNMFKKMYAV